MGYVFRSFKLDLVILKMGYVFRSFKLDLMAYRKRPILFLFFAF